MSKIELKKRFINGLKDYDLSYEDIVKSGWNYCGGDWSSHRNYWRLRFPDEKGFLPHANECVCGHDILHNGYICNKAETDFLVLGSCCITKFMPNGSSRTCENCGDKHKRRKVNYCFGCEKMGIWCSAASASTLFFKFNHFMFCKRCGNKCPKKFEEQSVCGGCRGKS
jgi:hypothetical protein